jgi:hypothetical protein
MITITRNGDDVQIRCDDGTPIREIIHAGSALLHLAIHMGTFPVVSHRERLVKIAADLNDLLGTDAAVADVPPTFVPDRWYSRLLRRLIGKERK